MIQLKSRITILKILPFISNVQRVNAILSSPNGIPYIEGGRISRIENPISVLLHAECCSFYCNSFSFNNEYLALQEYIFIMTRTKMGIHLSQNRSAGDGGVFLTHLKPKIRDWAEDSSESTGGSLGSLFRVFVALLPFNHKKYSQSSVTVLKSRSFIDSYFILKSTYYRVKRLLQNCTRYLEIFVDWQQQQPMTVHLPLRGRKLTIIRKGFFLWIKTVVSHTTLVV